MRNTGVLLIMIAGWLVVACQSDINETEQMDPLLISNRLEEKNKGEKIAVYQVFTRLFGNKNNANKPFGTIEENGVGKFNDFTPTALDALADMGYTHIWYTGVIEHAVVRDYSEYGIRIDDADVVKGRAGSPYAIKDYYDVNPDLAVVVENRMEEFEELVERTHEAGLKVIIDFVPNHVAREYHSDVKPEGVTDLGENDDSSVGFARDNNFYYLPGEPFSVPAGYVPLGDQPFPTKDGQFDENPAKVSGNNAITPQPNVDDWFETVKINYGLDIFNNDTKHFDPIPQTWHQMLEILQYWADKGVDGFRCDFVQFTPYEFWGWAIPQVKEQHPGVIFLAEIYVPEWYEDYLEKGNFDYLYDKVQLYDTLRHLMTGSGSTDNIPPIWKDLSGMNHTMLRFLENHDEQRIASPYFSGDPAYGKPGMLVSSTLYTGPLMVYFGQEDGEPGAGTEGFGGDDGRTTIFDYWGVPQHQKWMNDGVFDGGQLSEEQKELRVFYKNLINLSVKEAALAKGDLLDIHEYNRKNGSPGYTDKVYAYIRYTDGQAMLVVANFGDGEGRELTVMVPEEALALAGLKPGGSYTLEGKLSTSESYPLDGGKVTFSVEPLGAYIFELVREKGEE
ncbi:alpha-amylase family glycosyl hydrolase [Roseivirga sp. BDSF3-8]|uniref:alpha-amylase family glycosyl hydrolase n=1 Tax=Roseivirga sp. BDSF3-8 TaxID=3241598 RepID=UPI0035319910